MKNKSIAVSALSVTCACLMGALDKDFQVAVTASTWETKAAGGWDNFPPKNAIDGVVTNDSSWRGERHGEERPWILFTFSELVELSGVQIFFVQHSEREYTFDLQATASVEPKGWKLLLDKAKNEMEEDSTVFEFPSTKVKHLRLVGEGNTNERFPGWTNVVEVEFLEPGADSSKVD